MNKTHDITNEVVTEYIDQYYKPLNDDLGALRLDAEANNVPIIVKETETFLRTFFSIYKPKRVLEIGTAVGYSASLFACLINNVGGASTFLRRATFPLETGVETVREPKIIKPEQQDQLSLFDLTPDPVLSKLRELDLMNITPSEAIKILEDLKKNID